MDTQAPDQNNALALMSFMKSVFKEELNNLSDNDDIKILTVGIHALMLESGFICLDNYPFLGQKIDSLRLPTGWKPKPSLKYPKILYYTLPEVIKQSGFSRRECSVSIWLENNTRNNFVHIFGTIAKKGEGFRVHQMTVKRNRFVAPLDLAFVDSDIIDARIRSRGSTCKDYPEIEILEFQRLVTETLIYPLQVDLCEKMGFLGPTCFMGLPVEIKLKILGFLPRVDMAKARCTCSELYDLSSELHDLGSEDDLQSNKSEVEKMTEKLSKLLAERYPSNHLP